MRDPNLTLRSTARSLLTLFQSRRVLVALAAVIVGVITLLVPDLQALQDELLVLIVTVALVLIGGFSIDEAARIAKERAGLDEEQLRELIKQLLNEVIDEIARKQPKLEE